MGKAGMPQGIVVEPPLEGLGTARIKGSKTELSLVI